MVELLKERSLKILTSAAFSLTRVTDPVQTVRVFLYSLDALHDDENSEIHNFSSNIFLDLDLKRFVNTPTL